MRIVNITLAAAVILAALMVAGCSHKLIAHGGENTISVFHDKADFDKVQSLKSEGGAAGVIGGLGENFITTKVSENTRVKILSSAGESEEVEVVDGPNRGLHGYVSKDNVD